MTEPACTEQDLRKAQQVALDLPLMKSGNSIEAPTALWANVIAAEFAAVHRERDQRAEKLAEAVRKAVIAVADQNTPRSLAEKLLRAALAEWERSKA